ncbi:MAG: hypothetical protein H0V88_09475 [Pyrinomonadaceae bacterium]|nr:hypothetical protein [Pyrinomonadaceae bacterium]
MSDQKPLNNLSRAGRINRRKPEEPGDHKQWWETSRRKFIIGGAALAATGAALWGGAAYLMSDDTTDVDKDSLELQKSSGWNVGSEDKQLTLTGAQTKDSQQNENWRRYLEQSAMLSAYQPKSAQWMPFFVPTLIQSLQFETLRNQLAPIFTPDMSEAYGRGQTIAKEFLKNAENAGETCLIVDLPGRDSIAFGAGLADAAHLVTIFDNFPHPLGVTPSHETLGAMLYYAGEIESKQGGAPANSPAVFLLDSNRLATYKDADSQFDNRYLAKLPSAQKFGEMNIKSIIYITPDRTRAEELDDLNEDFVEYKNKNINVAMLPLSDFTAVDETVARTGSGGTWSDTERRYYYGGSPASHMFFFYSYPFYRPYPTYYSRYPNYSSATRSPSFRPPVAPPRYLPAARPTMFSGTRIGGASGVGRSKPSGFGRSTVRMSPSRGVVGTRAGRSGYYSPGRSGSFGRGGGYGG